VAALVVLGVLGLGALGGGGFVIERELTRPPTGAELDVASATESQLRWRLRSAGEIFPATVAYSDGSASGDPRQAHRIGIAPAAGCAQALDREVADVVAKHGCITVLRATYVDQSGTLLMTVGIAALADDKGDAVDSALREISNSKGVHPVAFPNTVAARFGDAQRQALGTRANHASYLFLSAEGWADGRRQVKSSERLEPFSFFGEILTTVMRTFGPDESPCDVKEIQC
jgi:hypothetical protein